MFKLGIKNRLLFSFLFLIIITLSVFGGYILWYFYQYNLEIISSNLFSQAQIYQELLQDYLTTPQKKYNIDTKLKEMSAKTNVRVTIVDPTGSVLADSWENPILMENHSDRVEITAALKGASTTTARYSSTVGQNLLYAAIPIQQNDKILGAIRVAAPLTTLESAFNRIKSTLLFAIVFTSFLAVILSIRLSNRFISPLEAITQAAKHIADGRLDKRVHIKTGDELELLAHTLNNLASNLDDKITQATAETNKLNLILQHMDNAVILVDRYGRVTTANKKARDVFGIVPSMLGQHNLHVIGNSLLDRAIHDTIGQAKNKLIDLKTQIRGAKRVFQVFLAPITAAENEIIGVLSVFHDITALQEIYERQADFVANASHELATPLTAIKGFAETLLDGALDDRELSTKFISIIHTEAERMHRLVKDLLQLAKLNSHEYRQQIKFEPISLDSIIDTVVEELSDYAKQKHHRVEVAKPAAPVTLMGNPDWLKQVLVNLFDNAIKYTPAHGHILIKHWAADNQAHIMVRDSGIGIPANDLPLIFDRFYRVDRARARTAGGTGLGLAIVKFIVEMHGGTINVKSEIDIGTTFTVSIPLTQASH